MRSLEILVVGTEPHEAQALSAAFGELPVAMHAAGSLSDALRVLADPHGSPPELVLLAEARPGIWTERIMADLRRAAPLARFVRLSGSWCEGQTRTGHPPTGVPSWPRHGWIERLKYQLLATQRSWSDPETTSNEDRMAAPPPGRSHASGELIVIRAARAAAAAALADLCRAYGYRTAVVGASRCAIDGARAVLWDAEPYWLGDPARVREIARSASGVPIVALVGFPRRRDIQAALGAGIAAVLAKPLVAADLFWQLERAGAPA